MQGADAVFLNLHREEKADKAEILIADDDPAIHTVVAQALSRAVYEVRTTGAAATLWRWVQSGEGDLVVAEMAMPDENAFELLPRIKKLRPELPIIVMSSEIRSSPRFAPRSGAPATICPSPST
jgi:DNA-binding NtrC family response regulator